MKKNGKWLAILLAIVFILGFTQIVMAEGENPTDPKVEWNPPLAVCDEQPDEVEIRGHNVNSFPINIMGELFAQHEGGEVKKISAVPPQYQEVGPDGWGGPEERIRNHYSYFNGYVWGWAEANYGGVTFSRHEMVKTKLVCGEKPVTTEPPPPVPICNKDNVSVKFGSNTATFTNNGGAGWAVFAVYDTHGFPNLQAPGAYQTLIGYTSQKVGASESQTLTVSGYDPSKDCYVQMDAMWLCNEAGIAATVPKKLTASNQGAQWNALVKAITRGSHVCEDKPTATPTKPPPTATATPTDEPTATPTGTLTPTDTPTVTPTLTPTEPPELTPTPTDKPARGPQCIYLQKTSDGYHAVVKSHAPSRLFEVYHIVGEEETLFTEGTTGGNQLSPPFYIGNFIAQGKGMLKAFIVQKGHKYTSEDPEDCELLPNKPLQPSGSPPTMGSFSWLQLLLGITFLVAGPSLLYFRFRKARA